MSDLARANNIKSNSRRLDAGFAIIMLRRAERCRPRNRPPEKINALNRWIQGLRRQESLRLLGTTSRRQWTIKGFLKAEENYGRRACIQTLAGYEIMAPLAEESHRGRPPRKSGPQQSKWRVPMASSTNDRAGLSAIVCWPRAVWRRPCPKPRLRQSQTASGPASPYPAAVTPGHRTTSRSSNRATTALAANRDSWNIPAGWRTGSLQRGKVPGCN